MQRNTALNVVKAASRLKVLARNARAAAAANAAAAAEAGEGGWPDGGSPLLDTDSLQGGSPVSRTSQLTPRDGTPLLSPRSGAASLLLDNASIISALSGSFTVRSHCGSHHHKAPPLPWYSRDAVAVKEMLLSSWLNLLVLAVPLGVASQLAGWGALPTFLLNFLGLIPLALLLGDVTEDLGVRFGDTVGGLLNATFGNVVEVILSLAALRAGLYDVVASSLLGSILSNLLLVLGCCMLFGGAWHHVQSFNAAANQASSSLLLLSCIGIILPTAATQLSAPGDVSQAELLAISRATALILLIVYGCYLVFQLHTHHDLFCAEDEEDEEPVMSLPGSLAMLTGITALVAVASEYLCGSIEEFSAHTGLSQTFLGIIVLPIAGNACEHITAVTVAMRNKMDLALGVAVGSSIQIALFAIPFAVVVGWMTGHDLTLDFDPFATLVLTVSVIHANFVTSDSRSHWLMGVALIVNYAVISVVFFFK